MPPSKARSAKPSRAAKERQRGATRASSAAAPAASRPRQCSARPDGFGSTRAPSPRRLEALALGGEGARGLGRQRAVLARAAGAAALPAVRAVQLGQRIEVQQPFEAGDGPPRDDGEPRRGTGGDAPQRGEHRVGRARLVALCAEGSERAVVVEGEQARPARDGFEDAPDGGTGAGGGQASGRRSAHGRSLRAARRARNAGRAARCCA